MLKLHKDKKSLLDKKSLQSSIQGEGKQEPDSYIAAVIGARERFLEKGFWGV